MSDKPNPLKRQPTNEERISAFVDDLTSLETKHRLRISGCGCCGSPWIENWDRDPRLMEDNYISCSEALFNLREEDNDPSS